MNQPLTTNSPNPYADTIDALCPKHGAYVATVLVPFEGASAITSRCPTCSAERAAESAAREAERIERERANKIAGLRNDAGIPTRFRDRTLAGYNATTPGQKRALTVCRRYVETWAEQLPKGTSLIFSGGPGTGKTHLACAIASALIETNLERVAFYTVTEALRSIKETYRKDSEESEQQAINALLYPNLLILDEVGVQIGSEHEKLLLFEVLNERYMRCRPTLLLSNLSAADLETYLGQRVMDRYRECGAVIAFDWQSHRGAK